MAWITTTRTAASWLADSSASAMAPYIAAVMEFFSPGGSA
jgi:hypothetical protein